MKYIKFLYKGISKCGILENENIKEIYGDFYNGYQITHNVYNLNEIKCLAPSIPSKVVAVGLNYVEHARELGYSRPENPVLFIKLPHTIIGHGDSIIIPSGSTTVDYEAELAVIIKKQCINVKENQVDNYILGATCLNDVTERDIQKQDGQWIRGKNFTTFCPIGPYIVNDIDYNNLNIKLLLNGVEKQKSNTKNFIWSVQEVVSFISKVIPLYPGDIVTTGTPSGIGPMKSGDKVEVHIEGVGVLENEITIRNY